jgi:hypothetical protein
MNSKDRHEMRYWRRKKKRLDKRKEFLSTLPSYKEVFSFKNLYKAYKLCKEGVMWKSSVQSYEANLFMNLADLHMRLMNHTYKSKGFHKFTIHERGKIRHISSVNIDERIVQRCLCDNYLIPLLRHNLIYDNSATLKGKGTDFAINRLKKQLNEYVQKNGRNGYILVYDFTDYFNSINHEKLYNMLDELIMDDDIRVLSHHFIDNFGERGLGLGSQISQICAVAFPNKIDHYFKDELGIKGYGRYMDDGYIFCKNLDEVKEYTEALYRLCGELDISISERKLHVYRMDKPFKFLKKKIFVDERKRIAVSVVRKTIANERRKLKKYYLKLLDFKMLYKDVECAYKSWRGNLAKYRNHTAMKHMDELFNRLFIYNKEAWLYE